MRLNEFAKRYDPFENDRHIQYFIKILARKYRPNSDKVKLEKEIMKSFYDYDDPMEAKKIIEKKLQELDKNLYIWSKSIS